MAKKSFKGGLDSLLSGSLPDDKSEDRTENPNNKAAENNPKEEPKEKEEHWLKIKNERLLKELHLWRTGRLDVKSFHESLKTKGLKYDSEKNIIY